MARDRPSERFHGAEELLAGVLAFGALVALTVRYVLACRDGGGAVA